ncbi:M23 family metallopeptidase [Lysinibacillus odysseyi]|uniref:M23ase beta-sheet core domain-containing protein n=1 Tax=Lysinibacillus odysseyi 34hs-1 = NBRC 100172 TaxID=1220589 RepID=A0A0A3IHW6_9BACI|nr:M23 family metallopeptidase [Lysinibacillus odysseyi]KGR84356.1 hypothetical protein CD32_12230 [Lysinibacillus odysseyi 34hs-1 = NBRC 100172]
MLHESIQPPHFGDLFHQGQFEKIYKQTSQEFQSLVTLEQFEELAAPFNADVSSYQLELSTTIGNIVQYLWLDDQREKAIHVSFDENGMIQSFYLKPYTTYPDSDKRYTENTYIMPISGDWFVFWGGTNEFINYHYSYENQRYAYDLIQVKDGASFKETPLQNEHFYAFNQEILSPAAGKVVKVIDGLHDNTPGEMDADNPAGNYVIIEHSHKEYSMLAHLRKHSIKVREGDAVTEGQCIGCCGNSGNSSEPHLHFQVMDSPDFYNATSIRIRFKNGLDPVQGDTIY